MKRIDEIISPQEAKDLQDVALNGNDVITWTIYRFPSRAPMMYIARPFSRRGDGPIMAHLQADSVQMLRSMLPRGLVHYPYDPQYDEPYIVEHWK